MVSTLRGVNGCAVIESFLKLCKRKGGRQGGREGEKEGRERGRQGREDGREKEREVLPRATNTFTHTY